MNDKKINIIQVSQLKKKAKYIYRIGVRDIWCIEPKKEKQTERNETKQIETDNNQFYLIWFHIHSAGT